MKTRWPWRLYPLLFSALASHGWAGGSGLNVAVVVNQNSSNSVELGNYYCEKRLVPPQNLLRTSWAGGNIEWTNSDFDSVILNPLLAMLSARGLANQIDYVVLCMDFPYRVVNTGPPTVSGTDSTTSALFYGFKADLPALPIYTPASCDLPIASTNAYAGSEGIFRSTPPTSSSSNSFLVTMITSSNLAQAKAIIDQGVASDGAFPLQTVYLGKSDDRLRNVRYALFDNAIFDTRLRGNVSLLRTNLNDPTSLSNILGYENGRQFFSIGPALFLPGAMADSLTSYGGSIFENTGHTPLLAFLNAGASGSYGTVVEPCNYFQKFPSPQTYFYQSRGFSLAECYYQSVTNPYQGLLVGEPLAAPFAQASSGLWGNLPANALLSGTTNLLLQFSAGDASHPLQQVDLFLDGMLAQTLTNIPPRQGNVLSVTLNGQSMTFTVLPNDTIKSVAARLVTVLNLPTYSNATKIRASARGDRIELQFFDLAKPGSQVPVAASSSIGSASALTTFISASGASLLDTVAYGLRGYSVTNTPMDGDYLQLAATKTNGQIVTTSVTNTTSGSTLADLAKALINAVNTNPALQSADGIIIEDVNMHEDYPYNVYVYGTNDHSGEFNIRARNYGWPQSQIQIRLSGSPTFTIQPSGVNRLDENVDDLQPRGHLYITAGTTNLPLTFGFNTATQANGFHELTAVAYQGSHVRTQGRVTQAVRIQNGPLSATFTTLVGDTNSALEAALQFSVVANTNNITKIELFSTGGSLGSVAGQSSATFSVAGTNLGPGLHPFYAIVTASGGQQYRTETKWIRLIGAEPQFPISITTPPPKLSWRATAGRSYDILSATNMTDSFQVRQTITPSNSSAQWTDSNAGEWQRFFRVRVSP